MNIYLALLWAALACGTLSIAIVSALCIMRFKAIMQPPTIWQLAGLALNTIVISSAFGLLMSNY